MKQQIARAIVSVSDKTNLIPFVKFLNKHNIEVFSTGGTSKVLEENNINHKKLNELIEFNEILDGRIKTLHPKVHGGILSRRTNKDTFELQKNKIKEIDLIVVNLYPFEEISKKYKQVSWNEILENIDIGGHSMLRAAAKNYKFVLPVVDPNDYDKVMEMINEDNLTFSNRYEFAKKTFEHTALYDANIALFFQEIDENTSAANSPSTLILPLTKVKDLRYGENPHQTSAFYIHSKQQHPFDVLQGKELSYNNILDMDVAYNCVSSFLKPACCIVKHNNPCGVATGYNLKEAYNKAYGCDPTSAFGGIISVNGEIDEDIAAEMVDRQFVEVIIARSFSEKAMEVFSKCPRIRVVKKYPTEHNRKNIRTTSDGILVQTEDIEILRENLFDKLNIVSDKKPTIEQLNEMIFAWNVCSYVKSNAIVMSKSNQTIGIGAGQMNRVKSVYLSGEQAKGLGIVSDITLASDAFFPFRDNIDVAASYGVKYIIQPGGSIRDQEVIDAVNEHGFMMVFTNIRHFRH